jgi:signal peptide peptidase SppA
MNQHLFLPELLQDNLWCILPAKLDEITTFLSSRLNGEQVAIDIAALQTKNGNRAGETYQVQDGVAVIPVNGVLGKKMNLMTSFSGGTSTELLRRDIQSALGDPSVKAIVLDVDSPGGTVDGTKEAADLVFNGRSQKPIIAYANGLMASAAYWIGSAAHEVIASPTASVGSLGVATMHFDRSGRDSMTGVKRTVLTTGQFKAIAGDEKPLSKEGRDYVLGLMKPVHDTFADSVASHRGMDINVVHDSVMNGRVWIGKQAQDVGLVDHIGNLGDAIALAQQRAKSRQSGSLLSYNQVKGGLLVNPEKTYEAMIQQAIAGGMTSAQAVLSVTKKYPELHSDWLRRLRAQKKVGTVSASQVTTPGEAQRIWNEQIQTLMASGLTKAEAITRLVRQNPILHRQWLEEINA